VKTSAAVIMAGLVGLIITAVSGFAVVPWLADFEFGSVRANQKRSSREIPSMGGLLIALGLCSSVAVTVVTDKLNHLGAQSAASGSAEYGEYLLPSLGEGHTSGGALRAPPALV
jgi:UDP-N-acetylmuramyl pentapeptide phosphotransferase/UDP-N-acetylglucosamine-1-phosphate transferase